MSIDVYFGREEAGVVGGGGEGWRFLEFDVLRSCEQVGAKVVQ